MIEKISNELTADELAGETGELLPDREAMSLVNANLAVPVNPAVAANVLSPESSASSSAWQYSNITQGI